MVEIAIKGVEQIDRNITKSMTVEVKVMTNQILWSEKYWEGGSLPG